VTPVRRLVAAEVGVDLEVTVVRAWTLPQPSKVWLKGFGPVALTPELV